MRTMGMMSIMVCWKVWIQYWFDRNVMLKSRAAHQTSATQALDQVHNYFIWSANVVTFPFSRCLVGFALVTGDFFTCLLSTWSHASLGNSWRWRPVSRSYWWIFYEYWFYWFQLLTQTLKDLRPFDICDCIKLFLRSSLTSWWTDHQEFVDQVSFVKSMYTNRLKPFILNTKSS